ncbi:hypothetical protein ID866_7502 [Astraeus odoratus]|nr:hypothetical protein ID866_7502 [Astraeus odoratus]
MSAPQIPSSLQIYNSYAVDPQWQRKFTIVWCSAVVLVVTASIPKLVRSLQNGHPLKGLFGISENLQKGRYISGAYQVELPPRSIPRSRFTRLWHSITLTRHWTLPYVGLNIAQLSVILAYLGVVLFCVIKDAPLISNPNRAGFVALAQFPVVFLFATKNSVLSLLLGPGNGYEKLNYIHRMAGRLMFLAACIHGSLWIRNHLEYGLPILGQQKETSGVASLSLLGVITLSSLRPIRRLFYEAFFVVQLRSILAFAAFFVTIRYHTLYAQPWIFPPLAFFALDVLLRFLRYRIKDAQLIAPDGAMTVIQINDCDDGWIAGQHVRLRVFFTNRMFETHPFTILSAPPAQSCITDSGMILAARVNGDWTRALNDFTRQEQDRLQLSKHSSSVPVHVMIDGPYGGSSVDLGQYETALLLSGGSGVTFTLGLLDDIVSRCVKLGRRGGEQTRRIEFVWCIRSFGHMAWFSSMLSDIANVAAEGKLNLHISIFVTCLCDPDAVPIIPNCDVKLERPSVDSLLREVTSLSRSSSLESLEGQSSTSDGTVGNPTCGGGVAVCASGPESLTVETQNAVANLDGEETISSSSDVMDEGSADVSEVEEESSGEEYSVFDDAASAAIEGDFDRLVEDIRMADNVSTAGMLQREWDFRVPDEEAFRDDLREATGIGKKRKRKRTRKIGPVLSHQVRALIGEGNQAYIDNDLSEAIRIMEEVIRIEPRAISAWTVLAQCYEDKHEPLKALQLRIMAAHLRHDAEEWERLARQSRELGYNQQALYCYSKLYSLDPSNVDALWDRATLAKETNDLRTARHSLLAILKRFPHDNTVLTELRPVLIELTDFNLCASLYQDALEHNHVIHPLGHAIDLSLSAEGVPVPAFGLIEILVLADLYNTMNQYERAVDTIRRGWRWLQGRATQKFWDVCEDDREYDVPPEEGGVGLVRPGDVQPGYYPLDINARHRLAISRLKMGDLEEGKMHASIILAQDVLDYAALFVEIADAYFEQEMYGDARPIYETLGADPATSSLYVLLRVATCRKMQGDLRDAAEVYRQVIDADPSDNDAKMKLAELYEIMDEPRKALELVYQVIDSRKRRPTQPGDSSVDRTAAQQGASLFDEKAQTKHKGKAANKQGRLSLAELKNLEEQREREVAYGYKRIEELWPRILGERADEQAEREWILEAEKLNYDFRGMFPKRRYQRRNNDADEDRMASRLELNERDKHVRKGKDGNMNYEKVDSFRGVLFDNWLRIFMQYAFILTKQGDSELPEEVLRHILLSNAYRSKEAQVTIRLAIIREDDDGTKGADVDEEGDEAAECADPSDDKKPVKLPTKNNPMPVTLYGQLCLAAKSYQSAIFYLLHAYDYCPDDPMICLCLAIASIGRAMQRQSDNRHHLIVQGMAFLSHYRNIRRQGGDHALPEIEFNFGRAFHQLGIHSLAVSHYEKVLQLVEGKEDYAISVAREAAYNLSLIYVTTGAIPLAENLYQKWLSI